MSIVSFARRTVVGSGWMRSAFAQSTATRTRSPMSSGSVRRSSPNGMNAYSRGTGVSPARYITASLPSWRSASVVASSDPSASPSGFSCVVTRNRPCARSASATVTSSLVVWGELIDQLCHAHAALDRRIVLERQLRGSLHSQLAREPRLQQSVRSGEPCQRRPALARRAEHAHPDRRVTEIGRRVDARDGDEADARILQLRKRLGEHLAHGLVDASHSLTHGCLVWQGRAG